MRGGSSNLLRGSFLFAFLGEIFGGFSEVKRGLDSGVGLERDLVKDGQMALMSRNVLASRTLRGDIGMRHQDQQDRTSLLLLLGKRCQAKTLDLQLMVVSDACSHAQPTKNPKRRAKETMPAVGPTYTNTRFRTDPTSCSMSRRCSPPSS